MIVTLSTTRGQEIANLSSVQGSEFFVVSSNGKLVVKTELDIMMSLDQYKLLHSSEINPREKRKTISDDSAKWKDQIVYYEISDTISTHTYKIKKAMEHFSLYTCIKFIEFKYASDRILFKHGNGCFSFVGRIGGVQDLLLNKKCATLRMIIHEIGHAIGFYHEHTRPDRDKYIYIDFKKMPSAYHVQFGKTPVANVFNVHTYDYTSIMHYKSLGVIKTLDPTYQDKIGRGPGLSFKDIKAANLLYWCSYFYRCLWKECPFNGFVLYTELKGQPRCECWCDSGNWNDPMILCSSISREVPEPNLLPASMLPQVSETGCIDIRGDCSVLNEQGLCRTKIVMMLNICSKTCGFCEKGTDLCMDLDDGCGMMAASGSCKQRGLIKMMNTTCPKSCGLCITASSPCDIQRSLMEPMNQKGSAISKITIWTTVLVFLAVASSYCL